MVQAAQSLEFMSSASWISFGGRGQDFQGARSPPVQRVFDQEDP